MNWKQTIGLVIAVCAIIALCFLVIFPSLYDEEQPEKTIEAKRSTAPEGERSVLPKLKGVNWETAPEAKKPSEKKPAKKAVKEEPAATAKEEAPEPAEAAREATGPASLLELQELTWYEQEGYVVVIGAVRNISDKSLPTVQAYVTFEGDEGWFISEEHAMIDLNPIFPDQVSPFTVISRYYPEITNAVVDFRDFSGESIPWRSVIVENPIETEETEEGEAYQQDETVAPPGAEVPVAP
jgi:hypothetical protein